MHWAHVNLIQLVLARYQHSDTELEVHCALKNHEHCSRLCSHDILPSLMVNFLEV